jgi:hypothetical protein
MDLAGLSDRVRALRAGRSHVFLGDPLGHAGGKTVVEPGNVSSPGVWTCGISLWVEAGDGWRMAGDEGAWRLDPPVATATWRSGEAAVRHELAYCGGPATGQPGCDLHLVRLDSPARLVVAVRGPGPAGSVIAVPQWDAARGELRVGGAVIVLPGASCRIEVDADPVALLALHLPAGELRFHVRHAGAADPPAEAWERCRADWAAAVPARIRTPDARVDRAWQLCAWHMLAAMERGLPRIGAVNYPGFWTRDGVIILRALDLIGRHDLARIGCDWLAPIDFAGGFGAESDAPGEGAWALAGHAALSRDRAWLAANAAHIERRAAWIVRMRRTPSALRAVAVERMPRYLWDPRCDLLCDASDDGLVRCRMDWHAPDFYGNAWCVAGLRAAVAAAEARGDAAAAARWRGEADDLEGLIAARLLPAYGNDRDPACAPWPTGCLAADPRLAQAHREWFAGHRLAGDVRRPEPLWTYFEAAQAHNALLLGCREEAWTCLSGMLDDDPAALACGEGIPAGNELLPFGRPEQARGWLDPQRATHGNMPHNWTTAELLAAMRDMLVREDGDGLAIGSGVPRAWLQPGAAISAEAMPTAHGPVSFTLTVGADGRVLADVRAAAPWRLDLPV